MEERNILRRILLWSSLVIYVLGLLWLVTQTASTLNPPLREPCLDCARPNGPTTIARWMDGTKFYLLFLPLLLYGIIYLSRKKISIQKFTAILIVVLIPIITHIGIFQYKIYEQYKPREYQLYSGDTIKDGDDLIYKVLYRGWQSR